MGRLRLREVTIRLRLDRMDEVGKLMACWMKKTGMLSPTRSEFPSFVEIFTAKPRTSRRDRPTLCCRRRSRTVRTLVSFDWGLKDVGTAGSETFIDFEEAMRSISVRVHDTFRNTLMIEMKIFSRKWKSLIKAGPRAPTGSVFSSSATGPPCAAVRTGCPSSLAAGAAMKFLIVDLVDVG